MNEIISFVFQGFLNLSWKKWQRVLLTRSIAILPTIFIATTNGIDQLTGLNDVLNVLMSMQLPFAVLPILAMTSNKAIMKEFANGMQVVFCNSYKMKCNLNFLYYKIIH